MHILSPDRPRSASGLPMLIWEGKPACIAPTVMTNMQPDGRIGVMLNTCINTSTARYFSESVDESAIGDWLRDYWGWPEGTLRRLGWRWNAVAPSIPVRTSGIAATLELDL